MLPYIDIVNETLEHVATNDGSPADMPAHQSTWTAAELRQFPEHRNVSAYNECATEVYPWSLPMHLSSVELGLYLQRLGVGRHEMMRALQQPDGTDPVTAAMVAEALGMTLFERNVVTGVQPADVAEAWNLSGAGFSTELRTTGLRSLLITVELELDALLRLLALRFVLPLVDQPSQWLVYPGGEPSCDLDDINLDEAFDDSVANRLHRFIRLSRKTGLAWAELDTALRLRGEQRSQPNGLLDQQFLAELVDLLNLRSRLGLELAAVVAISSRIETHDYEGAPSLYSRLFVSKANPDDAFELVGDEVAAIVDLDVAHHDTIRAGIRVNAADLELLIGALLPAAPAPQLDVATLSTLYAHAALARALRLRVDELLRLLALVDADPFASPAAGVQFVEVADEIAASRMSVEQLDYLCRHQFDIASGLDPSAADIAGVLQTITDGVAALEAELAAVAVQHPELREQLLAHLEAVFTDRQAIIDWMRILDQDAPLDGDADTLEAHVEALGMESDFVDVVLSSAPFPNYEIAIAAFAASRRQQGQNAVVDAALAEATGLAPEAAGILARNSALIEVGGQTVQAQLADPLALEATQIEAYLRVHKAALITSGLEIPVADLTWYFAFENDADTPNALDLNALPLASIDDGTEHLQRWRRVALGQALQGSFSSAGNPLPEIGADGLSRPAVADLFVDRTTWERDDVEYLLGPGFLALPDPVDPPLRDPRLVARIRDVIELVRRTGVRASVMASWARVSVPSAPMAAAARRALEARHEESAWADVVTPLTNTLRERQRDALVALIVQTNAWFADDIALFSALLVDPKMNACMLTSRIRLALSSVQLFTQRLLLGMEEAEIPDRLADDWSWMRIYRVWEANRSVFFWPENWAEPELRDDKTPFFRELEEQLDQGPLEERQVERAFADYLYKLHEVSHLDIVALYHEVLEDNGGERAHVLGRTRNLPSKHFYRVRVNNQLWTAWEQPPLEIESDQVVLVGHNRRLFMIWLQLREESEERENENEEGPPPTFYRFQLSWSERRDGEDWLPARSTPISEASTQQGGQVETTDLYLRTSIQDDVLTICVLRFKSNDQEHDILAGYVYDDCLDLMAERDFGDASYTSDQVGLVVSRSVHAQQQRTNIAAPNLHLTDRVSDEQPLQNHYLLLTPGPHRVVLSHPPHGLHVGQDTPATFDNDEHAFYITRRDVRNPYGGDTHPEPPEPAPEPEPAPLPPLDTIRVVRPWDGETPGTSSMTSSAYSQVRTGDTGLVLALSQQLVQTNIELGLVGGGNHIPVEMDEELERGYLLETFYHPYTCLMRSELNRHGVDGLLAALHPRLRRQNVVEDHDFLGFTWEVAEPRPLDDFDFDPTAAYGVYNWELFYHAPLYLAERLRREQRFEQAMRWYHFIFDPLGRNAFATDTGTERYWNVKPLYLEAKGELPNVDIVKYVFDHGYSDLSENDPPVKGFLASVEAWIEDPFSPHAIARWRPGTYRWVVLQRYLDNLIEWADSLFRRDTIETINEATQLYLLAAQILDVRPRPLPAISPPVSTYDQLIGPAVFGGFAELEDFMPNPGPGIDHEAAEPAPPGPLWWYFCVPPNKKLLGYWDTVADRLYKIRNCQNIDGVKRALALFDPPIDPALLVKAKAAGLDLGAVIADLQSPLPHHRYRVLAARALELVGDVRALGSALQQALERKDAEHLQELCATHEVALLKAVRQVREAQIDEAEENRKVLDRQMQAAAARAIYYGTRERRSGKEKVSAQLFKASMGVMVGAQVTKLTSGIIMGFVPAVQAGTGFFLHTGGPPIGGGLGLVADGLAMIGGSLRDQSSMLQVEAGYERRWDDWKFQEGQALLEQNQILQQQVAADIRTAVAEKELENHDLQAEQSKGVEEFLRTRYTNEQLYNWLVGQISTLYFQSYKLAYDLAKKAERAMRYELGNDDTYIEFGHWDSLRKGLLAGERLQLDLRRMEVAYLDKRRREYELSKRISLRMLEPSALLELQRSGTCEFAVPEVVFDLDHPGHYLRRIKAVSLTILAVTGPHVTLGAKLTLLEDIVRLNPDLAGVNYGLPEGTAIHEDERFRLGYGGVGSIATSTAQADSGLFTLDFNDERLLPFEGSGAISRWRLQLPAVVRQFDYDTITDVELQIQYTARDGGQNLRDTVENQLQSAIEAVLLESNGFTLLLSAREAFPEAWERFLYPVDSPPGPLEIPIVLDQLSYVMRGLQANVFSVRLVLVPRDGSSPISGATANLTAPGEDAQAMSFANSEGRWEAAVDYDEEANGPITITDQPWLLELDSLTIDVPDDLDNLFVVVHLVFGELPEP
ncbi:MAG: hypothetical protein IAG13_21925 [Deltaproteobacteria bacterium]|nr:hypothetical protein [Nannocystaceae bacterium]